MSHGTCIISAEKPWISRGFEPAPSVPERLWKRNNLLECTGSTAIAVLLPALMHRLDRGSGAGTAGGL